MQISLFYSGYQLDFNQITHIRNVISYLTVVILKPVSCFMCRLKYYLSEKDNMLCHEMFEFCNSFCHKMLMLFVLHCICHGQESLS